MPYRWWPATLAALNGIEPAEALQALNADRRLPRSGVALGLPVLSVWARTAAGRPLIVVLRHEGGLEWLIVGALDMTPAQRAEFEGWEASHATK
ncbi:hypothetical protein ACQP00_51730 [Dactylosporangium sp. CS-047395]|uniref:hypothetical protein n=1 Tax=Dactylosporangium sp. CS-047395 TaxID=3239936 RepID=UPI003D9088EE